MSRSGQIKYPFVLRTLEERLIVEEKFLVMFTKHFNDNPEWAKTNIDSCNHRMEELQQGIDVLKKIKTNSRRIKLIIK